jgi:transcriptional regulator with GAF, ATPase, and Fis domain
MWLISDILLVSFFALLLFSVLRFKPGYFKYYPSSFKRISTGLFVLILVLAAKVVGKFLSSGSQSYLEAAVWCGFSLGGLYLIWGFLHLFATGARSHSDFLHRVRQLVCVKAISSIPLSAKSYDQILKESLHRLMDIMQYKMGVVFKPSFNSHDMVLVGYWGMPSNGVRTLLTLSKDNPFFKEAAMNRQVVAHDEVTALPEYNSLFTDEDGINSFATVPLKFGDKILGVIGLYDTNPKRFAYHETLFLSSLGKLLGVITEQTLVSERNKWRREYISVAGKISRIFQLDKPIEKVLPRMAKLLRKVMEFEYLSLAITDSSGENMQRISVGTGGNVLLSRESSLPTRGTAASKVIESGKSLIQKDIEYGEYAEENLLKAIGVRSRLILPLSQYGALTLGSMKAGQYLPKDAKSLNLIGSLLSNILHNYEMNEEIRKKDNLLFKFKEITERTLKEKETRKVLSHIARDITQELPTSFCRISFIEKDRNNLNTLALEKVRDQGMELKQDKTHPLSLLPWHRMALKTGRTMVINQEDPESLMPDEECEQIMSRNLSSGLLVPIIMDQNPVGVLSVGEMRSWGRRPFEKEEIAFVKGVANQIPLLLERDSKISSLDSKTKPGAEEGTNQLGFEINSSLSTIYGSVELIRNKKKTLDKETLKYLEVIEKGGQRVQKAFKHYLKPQPAKDSLPEEKLQKEKITA